MSELEVKENLDEALEVLKSVRYKSYGFPIFSLYWNESFKCWDCGFRNPANFDNPEIKEDTPLKACNKMIEFLVKLKNKENEQ